ncbi:MAG: YfhO family protein, partial [Bacteroidota bacterium]
ITYYLLFILFIVGIAFLVEAIREKTLPQFLKATGILVIAGLLGASPNYGMLTTTLEYADETIRGKSELSPKEGEAVSSGLDKDYALLWSYGQAETFTLLIPNFHGGPTVSEIDRNTEAAQAFQSTRVITYWGDQPFTSGPVYVGAIICFLFVLGIMLLKGPLKWALLIATLLSILLAMGKNLEWFTDIFFYNVPLYNKFRAVTMALTIADFTMPLLGILGLHQVALRVQNKEDLTGLGKQILIAGGITGGICLIFWLVGPSLYSFSGARDAGQPAQAVDILRDLRIDLFKADALRSLFLIVLSTGALWLFVRDTLKLTPTLLVLGILILGDLWLVNKRYLGNDEFGRQKLYTKPAPAPADQVILQDTDPHFRVLNMSTGDPFQDPNTSFFHKSIGGYHPAKLRRYNDVISQYMQPGLIRMRDALQASPTDSGFQAAMAKEPVLNMINTRYVIFREDQAPARSRQALGNAWLVGGIREVESSDEEIAALSNFDPKNTAIVDKRFADQLEGFVPNVVAGEIELTEYSPNQLAYTYNSSNEKIAVFSEIYYNAGKGWQAYLDDEPVPHFRANYILRAMRVPAGEHTITFKMEPKTYYRGETLALISSIVLLTLFVGLVGYGIFKKNGSEVER